MIGIGFGLWFADGVAGVLISLDIVRDGVRNLRRSVVDLMDARPATYDAKEAHPLNGQAKDALLAMDWVRDAKVRLREAGHVFTGEALVVPADERDLPGRVQEAAQALRDLDWKLHDVTVSPVPSLQAGAGEAQEPEADVARGA
ncbi:MAG: hypothetical protein ACRDPC_12135 [Solirubrobacteraceae bacterium]